MNSTDTRDQATAGPPEAGEISLLEFLIVLAKRKWLLVGLPVVAALAAAAISTQLTPKYTATARLLPPQQAQSAATGLLGQLGALVGAAGVAGGAPNTFIAMMKSRTMADLLIDRFDLTKAWETSRPGARGRLMSSSQISFDRDGLLVVSYEDPDPKLAATIANAYGEELERLTTTLAVTEAARRRLFFERQLAQAKDSLIKAELAAHEAFEKGGLASVDIAGNTIVQATASLRARITAKELEMSIMRGVMTEENPQYQRAQRELAALRDQLWKLERGDAGRQSKPASEQGLKNIIAFRELKYHEALYDILARQYEAAKLDESKEGAVIQTLDKALAPESRSAPRRGVIVMVSAFGTLLAALVLVVVLEGMERARRDPQSRERLAQLASYLGLRRR